MKPFYKIIGNIAHSLTVQSTYFEMEYHLKQAIQGMRNEYLKNTSFSRCNGKTTALARLSAKYSIPIMVPNEQSKIIIERTIPSCFPKYFKRNKPTAVVMNDFLRDRRYDIVLVESNLSDKQFEDIFYISKRRVGYRD